ncbi:hypothetical protein [Sphingomonas qomolangmaensis]|uniref:Glycosyltransferase RgtA/B/C/D-like domain-containing protein n=1 Tax=Sphingomonas qomolangmaensis TaxID=2918765 RepID=A0ABY5L766_9SPHN|nr:hypothetical protein [Sphingomonas qomolangmaensis]UUL81585.1 hypothetical protein NMP03_10255 [Sphingomonas qomolangmaensis]
MASIPRSWSPSRLPRWAVLLLVAFAARAVTLGNPILQVDEQFYFVTAHAMHGGALPYVDIWDRKPIGLFLLYLPAAALGWPNGIVAYQILALAAAVGTAFVIAVLADRAGWRRGALAAAILYILWLNFAEGQGGQSPVFYNLLVVGAVAVLASSATRPRALGAMLLLGLAIQIKYSVVFEGAALGCWVLWQRRRDGALAVAGLAAAMIALAVAPTAAAWLWYARAGQSEAFLYANFLSILARSRDPIAEQAGNFAFVAVILAPLLVLAWLGRRGGNAVAGLLHLWLLAALAGLFAFGGWYDHYALPVIAAACACAAGFFAGDRRTPRATAIFLVALFIGGQGILLFKRHERGSAAQFAAIADAVGPGPGCLLVYSGATMLYPATGRCRTSHLVFPSHFSRTRERGAVGIDQAAALAAALAMRPERIVADTGYRGERPAIRRQLNAALARDYVTLGAFALGRKTLVVYAPAGSADPARRRSTSS